MTSSFIHRRADFDQPRRFQEVVNVVDLILYANTAQIIYVIVNTEGTEIFYAWPSYQVRAIYHCALNQDAYAIERRFP